MALLIERAAQLQLLAMSAGQIQPIPHGLATEAHDWVSTDKRNKVNFAYYARKALKNILAVFKRDFYHETERHYWLPCYSFF